MDFKKYEFRDFDSIIRFAIKNESEIEKLRSRDRWIFLKIQFYENETHNSWSRDLNFSISDLFVYCESDDRIEISKFKLCRIQRNKV